MNASFVDIHCHLLPGIDDGAKDLVESLAMARMAVEDGTKTIIVTPHQLGVFGHNGGDDIRRRVSELQQSLRQADIPLTVLPGADVRIEAGMIEKIAAGDVLTLADRKRHVLLELPHELYLPLEPVLAALSQSKFVGILSHPERNEGILRKPDVLPPLVESGCLLQITAGSLCGTFGRKSQDFSEKLIAEGMIHFIASDGHGARVRRPLLRRAYERVAQLTDEATARDLCCRHPQAVVVGERVPPGRRGILTSKRRWFQPKSPPRVAV